jgi:hypothetical protein
MNEKRITVGLIVAGVVAAIIVVLVSTIFGFLFFEKPWLRYTNIPFPALETYAYPGKVMPIHVVRCNSDSVPHIYNITRTLERVVEKGEARDYVLMADIRVQIMPGCDESDSVVHTIPLLTRPGKWRLVGLSEIQGVLVTHMVEWYSVPFTVLPAPPEVPTVVIINGKAGPAGPAGVDGKAGKSGAEGRAGKRGADGDDGKNGKNFWGK